jgi:RNA polymerase sigma factor (sigma-70 family)
MDHKHEALFNEMYINHYKPILNYVYHLTYDKGLSEDIAQDTFLEAYRSIEVLLKHINPVGWLYVTARNKFKAHLRLNKLLKDYIPLDEYDVPAAIEPLEDSAESVLSCYISSEDVDIMLKFYKDNQSLTEIAADYHVSLSACKMRLKRARDKFIKKYKIENNY